MKSTQGLGGRVWRTVRLGSPALVVVAAVDGYPLVSLGKLFPSGSLRLPDICVGVLVAMAFFRRPAARSARVVAWRERAVLLTLALGLCWTVALGHALLIGGSLINSLLYGRDFLFLAALIPTSLWLFPQRRHWDAFVVTLVALGTVLAVLTAGVSTQLLPPSVVHADQVREVEGVIRIWSANGSLIIFVFALALGNLMLKAKPQTIDIAVTVALGASIVLTLSRALYFGLIAALVLSPILWSLTVRRTAGSRRIFRRLATGALVVVVALFVGSAAGVTNKPLESVSTRASAGVSELSAAGGNTAIKKNTLSYRLGVANQMLNDLGNQWVTGLGFVHPRDHYFVNLKDGSIRDVDIGILGPVMTMGIFGVVVLFIPLFALVFLTVRYGPLAHPTRKGFLFGILYWAVFSIASSPTLGVVVNSESAIILGIAFGLGLRGSEFARDESPVRRVSAQPRRAGERVSAQRTAVAQS